MLKQQNRLKNNRAFLATYRHRQIFSNNFFSIYLGKPKKDDTPIKIGFVVSNKIHKRAVKRNRLKRLMRETLRLMLKENAVFNLQSMVIVAKNEALTLDFRGVFENINSLVEKSRQAYKANHTQQ